MAELVRLQICVKIDVTWAWVALGPERQPDAATGAPEAAEDAPTIDEGRMARLGKDVSEIPGALTEQREGINTKEMNGERDDFKYVEAEEKSNLKTSL
ncbi:hypothetical protein Tco_0408367 [Tanacetum coccineum]